MASMSSSSRPSTPNRPIQAVECPGAPLRIKTSLTVSIPEGMGRALVFPDAMSNGAPDAPRASDAPWAPKKARFAGNFTGPEMTPMNIQF
jgi:hypothetical protein